MIEAEDFRYHESDMFSFSTYGIPNIGFGHVTASETNGIDSKISCWAWNDNGYTISSYGFFFGETITGMNRYTVNNNIAWTNFYTEKNVSDYVGLLKPNTTYYYRFYGIIDTTYYSDIYSFTTTSTIPEASLDVNGLLDGEKSGWIDNYGTFDVYINGERVADNVSDYCRSHPYGTTFTITDIHALKGHTFDGVAEGSLSGTISKDISIRLRYFTNSSILTIDPNGGNWNNSTETQSFKQQYNTTKSVPVPTRDGYTFFGWDRINNNGEITTLTADAIYTYGDKNDVVDTLVAQWICSGDLDGDGVLNMNDAFTLYRAASGQLTLTDEQATLADMDGSGTINMADAFALYRRVSGNT